MHPSFFLAAVKATGELIRGRDVQHVAIFGPDGTSIDLDNIVGGEGITFVNTVGDLDDSPAADTHPVVLVLDSDGSGTMRLYAWSGTEWKTLGGGGGGEIPTDTPFNLFVQEIQPTSEELFIDSLWIPVDGSGVPAEPEDWQVNTGSGDGNGGNLIIGGSSAPTVAVDTLWIPTSGGIPAQFYEWQVLSGHGSVEGAGNPNLFFNTVQPSAAPLGSLWVPLNSDQTPKSPDFWRVNA